MIKVENIKKVFNPHSRNKNTVLKGVSFELPEKGLVAIFGKSGSGKTTLLNIIGGLDKQDSGKVYIDGLDTSKKTDYIRNAKIGYIFQNYYLESGYTIGEIMEHSMVIAGFNDKKEIEKRTEEVLRLVRMERYKNKKCDALSGGQKQRVAIARALIKGSDIILADEPTGNLDAENTIIIMDILKEISKNQLVVLVTHEVTLIHNYADSHIKIVDGELKDNEELEIGIKYEIDKNNIYVDSKNKHSYTIENTNIDVYTDEKLKPADIEIFSKNGNVYLRPGKGVTVLDDKSEKKIIFDGTTNNNIEKIDINKLPKFEKSNSKKNGKLFNIKNIFKAKKNGKELSNSVGNVFKGIFISAIAIVMCFFSLSIFEVVRSNIINKSLSKNSTYVELNAYDDLFDIKDDMCDSITFFDTRMKRGEFSITDIPTLSGIECDYIPKPIEKDTDKDSLNIKVGKMPKMGEVLISTKLAKDLKREFRMKELKNDKSLLLVVFNGRYSVSGIVDSGVPEIYMNKQDYVNFLGVYHNVVFNDSKNLFFTPEFQGISFTCEFIEDKNNLDLGEMGTLVEINRNSLYKMMADVVEADYLVKATNAVLMDSKVTDLEIKDSHFFVKKLKITRDVMETDVRIYVSSKTMKNIFIYMNPDINNIKEDVSSSGIKSSFYYEIISPPEKIENLNNFLNERNILSVDVLSQFEQENNEAIDNKVSKLNIFLVLIVLLFLIYYFIEKSGSLKISKEYGIYRAIGVNKGNLIYKETITTIFENIILYFICFLVIMILMSIRYYCMNVVFNMFIVIGLLVFLSSSILMVAISLLPYLFVLYKTPADIIARYDI